MRISSFITFLAAAIAFKGVAMSADTNDLFPNASFESGSGLPIGCETFAPWDDIAPTFTWDTAVARTGKRSLKMENRNKPGCYGRWRATVKPLPHATHFRIVVYAKAEGIKHIGRSVAVELSWLGPGPRKELFHGKRGWQHVHRTAQVEDGWHRFERIVWRPKGADALRVDMMLRWTDRGTVWFDDLRVEPAPAPKPRPVRLAVSGTRCKDADPVDAARYWADQIAIAANEGVDLVVLPEYSAGPAYDDPPLLLKYSSPVPGPATDIIAAAAKKAKAFVVYNLLENDRNVLYNTSVLFDREGEIVGKYRKVHLAIFETWAGITPGQDFPVFDTELGKIGMLVCWDNTFPESSRMLTRMGAEIIATNNGTSSQWRAEDSAVVIAQANTGGRRGCIVDIDGAVLAEVDEFTPFIYATVDLSAKKLWKNRPQFDDARSRMWNERRTEAYGPLADDVPNAATAK